jgi:hypothetical protein
MNIYISIDGVLRNFINRFHYHYEQAYIDVEESDDDFEYKVIEPLSNLNISDHFVFQSKEQQDYFQYIEYPMELYGHSPASYNGVNNDINKLVHENKEHTITLVGLDELGKSRAATFFFLSRNGIMVNNVKFVLTSELEKEWENVDLWISDSKKILDTKPENKKFILFQTKYNEHIECDNKIEKLNDLNING